MTVITAHGVVQATLMVVFLGNVETAVFRGTFDGRVLAVQHDMIMHVDTMVDPLAAGPAVGAFHDKLIQHILDNLGHRSQVSVGLNSGTASGTCLATVGLGRPSMVETFSAKIVFAGQLHGLVEGGMADEADEVAIGGGDVFEGLELGRDFDDAASPTLR